MHFSSKTTESQLVTKLSYEYVKLAQAIKLQNLHLLEEAIKRAVNPTELHYTLEADHKKYSALHLAAYYGFVAGTARLLDLVANPEEQEDLFGECILLSAVNNYPAVTAEFIKYEFNREIVSTSAEYNGFTAMHFAILHRNEQMEFNLKILGFPPISIQDKLNITKLQASSQANKLSNACVIY